MILVIIVGQVLLIVAEILLIQVIIKMVMEYQEQNGHYLATQ